MFEREAREFQLYHFFIFGDVTHNICARTQVLGRSRGRHRWHFKVIDVGVGGVSVGISGALVSLNRPLGTLCSYSTLECVEILNSRFALEHRYGQAQLCVSLLWYETTQRSHESFRLCVSERRTCRCSSGSRSFIGR